MKRHVWEQAAVQRARALMEGFREKKAQWIEAGASEADVDGAIARFKALKQRRRLAPEEADIDHYETFEQLQQLLAQAEGRVRSPSAKTREVQRVEDADVLHDGAEWTIVVPHTAKTSQLYGRGTRWCTSGVNNCLFNKGKYLGIKHYIFISKTKSSADPHYKLNLAVYPNGNKELYDATDVLLDTKQLKDITGFSADEFGPWVWQEAPAQFQWGLANLKGVPFSTFLEQVSPEAWDMMGQRVEALKSEWLSTEDDPDEPGPRLPRTEEGWKLFWRQCREEGLTPSKPTAEQLATLSPEKAQAAAEADHRRYLTALNSYLDMMVLESRAQRLVKALLERSEA